MRVKASVTDDAVYAAVAQRRAGFDSMVWQVPIISLTAQAFLLTIALGPDSTALARAISAALASLVSFLSMILMARHRQAETADAKWLLKVEKRRRSRSKLLVHSGPWRRRRDSTEIGGVLNVFMHTRMFYVWEAGLFIFLLVGLAIIPIAIWAPEWLSTAAL